MYIFVGLPAWYMGYEDDDLQITDKPVKNRGRPPSLGQHKLKQKAGTNEGTKKILSVVNHGLGA